jgi:hypothetical protein
MTAIILAKINPRYVLLSAMLSGMLALGMMFSVNTQTAHAQSATPTPMCADSGGDVGGVLCQDDIDAMQNGILEVVGLVIRLGVSLFLAFSPLAGIKGGFAFAGSLLRGVVAAVSNFRM